MEVVKFSINGQIVNASHELSILEACHRVGIDIPTSCGGFGTCGACRIIIKEGLPLLGPRNELEVEMASDRGFSSNERLSCQCGVQNGLVLECPHLPDKK